MKKKIIVIILFLAVGICGCTLAFQDINNEELGLKGIKQDMNKAAVIKVLGEPKTKTTMTIDKQEYEAWNYPIQRRWAGKFKPMGDYSYRVLFLDNKVSRWDKVKIFSRPDYELEEHSPGDAEVTTIKILEQE